MLSLSTQSGKAIWDGEQEPTFDFICISKGNSPSPPQEISGWNRTMESTRSELRYLMLLQAYAQLHASVWVWGCVSLELHVLPPLIKEIYIYFFKFIF